MIIFLQKWWQKNGWFYIIVTSLVLLFFLWIFISNKDNASSEVNMDNVVSMMLKRNDVRPEQFQNIRAEPIQEVPELDNMVPRRSKGEQICYEILVELTGKEFTKIRPNWLINPITRECMEIDLYNEELQLGVEYNGRQHEEYNDFMHQGSKEKFRAQQYRDYLKNDICKKRGVYLITVSHKIKHKDIRKYLEAELKKYLDSFKQ